MAIVTAYMGASMFSILFMLTFSRMSNREPLGTHMTRGTLGAMHKDGAAASFALAPTGVRIQSRRQSA